MDDSSLFELAAALARTGVRFAVITVIQTKGSTPRKAGAKMLVCADGTTHGSVGGGRFELEMVAEARAVLTEGAPRIVRRHLTRELAMCCGGEMEAYIEPIAPRETLVLAGAGHINEAVASFGAKLGFEVALVDELEALANRTRFPDVARFISSWSPADWGTPLDRACYIVIATREHAIDQQILEQLAKLGADPAYLGVISSRRKITRFRKQLEVRGVPATWIEQVRGPIGLPIDAETPAEIAVAVAAELVAVRRARAAPTPPSAPETA